jgi:O-acetyl-ADP-ribose deacetylase (regulator of RNase III)
MASSRIQVLCGSILECRSGVLVHGVNSAGAFGAGVAKQIRARYPSAFMDYAKAYYSGKLVLGSLSGRLVTPKLLILNAVIQDLYGREPGVQYVNYDAIGTAFKNAVALHKAYPNLFNAVPQVFSFPLIGCGLAGGNWDLVEPQILENVPEDWSLALYLLPGAYRAYEKTGRL